MDEKKLRKEKQVEGHGPVTRPLLLAGQLAARVLGQIARKLPRQGFHALRANRRLLFVAGLLAAVSAGATLTGAVTFGLFSGTTSAQTSTLASGTVTLTSNVSGACTVGNMLPGSSPTSCALVVSYSGTVPAYLGLDVLIATESQSPGTVPLYNPSDPTNDLQIMVNDSQNPAVTYFSPTTVPPTGVACNTIAGSGYGSSYTCYQLNDLLVSTAPFTSTSSADTFNTSVSVPTTSATGYQGGTASIVLLAHAVQSGNQTLGSCSAGTPCTSMSWS